MTADRPARHSALIDGRWHLRTVDGLWLPVRWWHPADVVALVRDRLWARRAF